jgi:hypothetical protein
VHPIVCEIKDLIDNNGPLMAGFITQAIEDFAGEVAKADPAELTQATNNMVSGDAWIDCAKQILAKRKVVEHERAQLWKRRKKARREAA